MNSPCPAASPLVEARYGYLFATDQLASLRLAAQLLREQFNLAVATEPFALNGRQFARGAILARVERNPASLRERLDALTRGTPDTGCTRIDVLPLNSARVESGADFGEDPIVELKAPKIAVVTGEPADDRSYGATWFTLEHRLGLPFTAIKIEQLKGADLRRYETIVLPHGSPATYQEALGESGLAKLKRWAEDGGTLVLVKGSAALATRKGVEWTTSTLKRHTARVRLFFDAAGAEERARTDEEAAAQKPRQEQTEKKAESDKEQPPTREMDLVRTPGAILRVKVDPEHFLGFGYRGDTSATVQSNYAFTLSRNGVNAAAFADEASVKLAGFMWPEARTALARTLFAWVEPAGRGQMILFAEDPNFRASQLSTMRMFFNAVILGPAFAR